MIEATNTWKDDFGMADIYGCPTELKGQLKIGDFCG